MIKNITAVFALSIIISGCARTSPSILDGYTGPRATVSDSIKRCNSSKSDWFYIQKINGKNIEESLSATLYANLYSRVTRTYIVVEREVPAQNLKVVLVGRTFYMGRKKFSDKAYKVQGEIEFSPKAGLKYVVKGKLGPNYSGVWIEGEAGEIVTKKIEVNGSTEYGFFF